MVRTRIRLRVVGAAAVCALFVCLHGTASQAQLQLDSHATLPPEARIDINSATVEELLKVPGMTRTWAERIIRFRPYRAKDDLLQRGVVTSQLYDRIKVYVIAHRERQ
jgi:DNA uptake protein ComE-like DNA-binding protein